MDNVRFSSIRKRQRSQFPLNKMHTTTGDFFRWDVVLAQPLIPNDSVSLNIKSFVDSGPNPFPINGSASYGMYAFFCPNRLVWDDWKYFINGELKPGLTKPFFTIGDLVDAFHSDTNPWKDDYFDTAVKYVSNIDGAAGYLHFVYEFESSNALPTYWKNFRLDAMPLRMANRAWWDWMRDKVHISDAVIDSYCFTSGGHITLGELIMLCAPRYRCFPKNFFTTSFDTPQEGAVGAAPVSIRENDTMVGSVDTDGSGNYTNDPTVGGASDTGLLLQSLSQYDGEIERPFGVAINDIRKNSAWQQLKERLLFAGKTVKSRGLALFGVSPTIEELQMSNYLGGHEEDLQFETHMADVSSRYDFTNGDIPKAGSFGIDPAYGNIAGQKYQNITSPVGDGFCGLENVTYSTDEDGYLFVFAAITPHVQYYQGIPRNWTRCLQTFCNDVHDYPFSDFENQPLQPSFNYEVCAKPDIDPMGIFGFNLMYADWKMSFDSLGGEFIIPSSKEVFGSMHLGRDIYGLIEQLAHQEGGQKETYLTPAVLTQSTGIDVEQFDGKFTISDKTKDHFIVNHKITLLANRPLQGSSLPSLDATLSALSPRDTIETGGFRL